MRRLRQRAVTAAWLATVIVACSSPRNEALGPDAVTGTGGASGETSASATGGRGSATADADISAPGPDVPARADVLSYGDAPAGAAATGGNNGAGATCAEGQVDCETAVPGCEATLGTNENCAGCGMRCPSGQQCEKRTCVCKGAVCGGTCVDLQSDSKNCGSCDRACPGACAGGACVCTTPTRANLVENGGFDVDDAGWKASSLDHQIVAEDGGGCPQSHAIAVSVGAQIGGSLDHCVTTIDTKALYRLGAWARIDATSTSHGHAFVSVQWIPRAKCAIDDGSGIEYTSFILSDTISPGTWSHVERTSQPPSTARSANVHFGVQKDDQTDVSGRFSATFDMIYLTPDPGGWN
jgi:hypothetical protein